ncbi:MAG TPA: hypothetical protein VK616_11370 [Flavitalea sp.]|nr:hypothetical protein [Flavitalea sp.]
MQTQNIISSFEYTAVPSVTMASFVKTARRPVAGHLPLMLVKINFKDGKLILEGDWHFLVASNKHTNPYWFSLHSGRVGVVADIYPAGVIDLDDYNNDGLVFQMEGIIKDGSSLNSCSGLIVLDKIRTSTGISTHKWDISFYLYDYEVNNCEIKLKLPVYTTNDNRNNN